ncbi:MAG: 6-phosphogluconolactonase, partial [Kangiellaceae bacterium]
MNKNITIKKFENRELLFASIANDCEKILSHQINLHGQASFIIPGGTTPSPAFNLLSNANLKWESVTIAQSDERWVDATHAQSNEKL